jgi:hypothetical protein
MATGYRRRVVVLVQDTETKERKGRSKGKIGYGFEKWSKVVYY